MTDLASAPPPLPGKGCPQRSIYIASALWTMTASYAGENGEKVSLLVRLRRADMTYRRM